MKSRNLRKKIGAMVRLSMSRGPNRVSDNTVSDNAVSDNTVSDNVVSDNTVSDDTVGGTVSSFVVSSTVRETPSLRPGCPQMWMALIQPPAQRGGRVRRQAAFQPRSGA